MDSRFFTDFFKIISDETRLRCLALIHEHGKLCVCDLEYALELSQPKISRHLARMRLSNLLETHRKSQWVFYSISKQIENPIPVMMDAVIMPFKQTETFQNDTKRLLYIKNHPEIGCSVES